MSYPELKSTNWRHSCDRVKMRQEILETLFYVRVSEETGHRYDVKGESQTRYERRTVRVNCHGREDDSRSKEIKNSSDDPLVLVMILYWLFTTSRVGRYCKKINDRNNKYNYKRIRSYILELYTPLNRCGPFIYNRCQDSNLLYSNYYRPDW